jgi:hypothetical protein
MMASWASRISSSIGLIFFFEATVGHIPDFLEEAAGLLMAFSLLQSFDQDGKYRNSRNDIHGSPDNGADEDKEDEGDDTGEDDGPGGGGKVTAVIKHLAPLGFLVSGRFRCFPRTKQAEVFESVHGAVP